MTAYHPRNIKFDTLFEIDSWRIKIYTIAKHGEFNHLDIYNNAKAQLSDWLKMTNGFNSNHNHIGFLILHSGTEGVFSLVNWWVGDNMLNTNIYKTDFDTPDQFEKISGYGLAPCVWELEVINNERLAWTEHILKKAHQPDYKRYLNTTFNKVL